MNTSFIVHLYKLFIHLIFCVKMKNSSEKDTNEKRLEAIRSISALQATMRGVRHDARFLQALLSRYSEEEIKAALP